MEIQAERVAVDGPHGPLLRPTSLLVSSGQVLLATGEGGSGHTALGLVLTGRMKPSHGRVLIDGTPDIRLQRRKLAIVDAPGVTEPEDALSVRRTVAEGLALAGRRSGRRQVRTFLTEHGAVQHAEDRWESLAAKHRIPITAALATARSGVEGIVLDTPDRHGGPPIDWYSLARRYTEGGLAVLVLCSPHSARQLGVRPALIGELRQPTAPTAWSPPTAEPVATTTFPEAGK